MAAWWNEICFQVEKDFTRLLRLHVKYFSMFAEKFHISAWRYNILYLTQESSAPIWELVKILKSAFPEKVPLWLTSMQHLIETSSRGGGRGTPRKIG